MAGCLSWLLALPSCASRDDKNLNSSIIKFVKITTALVSRPSCRYVLYCAACRPSSRPHSGLPLRQLLSVFWRMLVDNQSIRLLSPPAQGVSNYHFYTLGLLQSCVAMPFAPRPPDKQISMFNSDLVGQASWCCHEPHRPLPPRHQCYAHLGPQPICSSYSPLLELL